jgi:hypothetical protein
MVLICVNTVLQITDVLLFFIKPDADEGIGQFTGALSLIKSAHKSSETINIYNVNFEYIKI